METIKKIGIILGSLILTICLGLDIWFAVLYKTAPDKVVSWTFKVGNQEITDAKTGIKTNKHFCEINVFDNVYEIKFNYLQDEEKNAFYSQGFQFIATSESNKIDFNNKKFKNVLKQDLVGTTGIFGLDKTYNRILSGVNFENMKVLNYATDGNKDFESSNKISDNYKFKLEIGEDIYILEFKNEDIDCSLNNSNFLQTTTKQMFVKNTYNEYRVSDVYMFAEILYRSIENSTIRTGETTEILFELGDLFKYYKYDENSKQYTEISVNSDSKVLADIKSYYSILVTVNEGNITSAQQSLFKMVDGNSNFKTSDAVESDYFTGTTLLRVDEMDFDWISTENSGEYKFKLSEDFKKIYGDSNSKKLKLYIYIDADKLNSQGVKFAGFEENAFDNFNISKIVIKTNGEIKEVQNAWIY